MPLFLPTPCKTCGTGQPWPADARFCRTCGRPAHWSETAAGRWRVAAAVTFAVVLLVGVVGLALVLTRTVRHVVAVPARVASRPSAVVRPVPIAPAPPVVPATPPATASSDPPAATPDAAADPPTVPSAPGRPGDTDLASDPLAAYAGGPSADHLAVHGVGPGVAVSAIPDALVAKRTPGHLQDVGGNVYDVADGRVTQVHVREAAVLDRMPIDGTHALLARFGDPDRPPQDVGAEMFVLEYAARGIDVRWDDGVQHLDEVTLYAPRAPR